MSEEVKHDEEPKVERQDCVVQVTGMAIEMKQLLWIASQLQKGRSEEEIAKEINESDKSDS